MLLAESESILRLANAITLPKSIYTIKQSSYYLVGQSANVVINTKSIEVVDLVYNPVWSYR